MCEILRTLAEKFLPNGYCELLIKVC